MEKLYLDFELESRVSYNAFLWLMKGYRKLEAKNRDILTLIDYSKPSTEERLYVFDMKNKKLLFISHVAHGKNSGDNYATSFSNENNSHKSSLGFYLTEKAYQGSNGYSLVLNGLEKGVNDRAKERAVVMHGADYANPAFISRIGRLGRSFGCPSIPIALTKPIINTIKDGTLLFIYADDADYMAKSTIFE